MNNPVGVRQRGSRAVVVVLSCSLAVVGCNQQETATDASPVRSVQVSKSDAGSTRDGPWWKQGPAATEMVAASSAPSADRDVSAIDCDSTDPFWRYIKCPAACHFAIGRLGTARLEQDGNVQQGGPGFLVSDVRVAPFEVAKYLVRFKRFTDGARQVFDAPRGRFEVEEAIHGFSDIYSNQDPPRFLRTNTETRFVVSPHARLIEEGRVLVGLRHAANEAAPDRRAVTAVIPVLEDGRVDMSVFHGTTVTRANGYAIDTPTEPVSVREAKQWLKRAIEISGISCKPTKAGMEDRYEKKSYDAPQGVEVALDTSKRDRPTGLPVDIRSVPSGAEVKLNGKKVGRTPLTVPDVSLNKKHKVELSLRGYHKERRELSVDPNLNWSFSLRPRAQ